MAQLKINNQMWMALNAQNGAFSLNSMYIDVGMVYIFQGVRPEGAEALRMVYNSVVSTAGLGTRGADALVKFNTANNKFVVSNNTLYVGEVLSMAATGTGVATWAAVIMGIYQSPNGQLFIGDVSSTASDAFLQINDVNITAGEKYKILGMQITFDHEYTF